MNTSLDPQLSSEFQERYLRNKQWLSDARFLDNESVFFQKLFNKALSSTVIGGSFKKINSSEVGLDQLEDHRNKLREFVSNYQHLVDALMTDHNKKIGRELTTENEAVNNEIKALLVTDILVKKKLHALVEEVIGMDKTTLPGKYSASAGAILF